jgi:hypothetical protein
MMPKGLSTIMALGARRTSGHRLRRAATTTALLGRLVAVALGMVLITNAEAGPRRPSRRCMSWGRAL